MAVLELTLLGGCEGSSGPERPLRLSNKKAWALLAYLALQPGRAFDREHLANLLWGDRFDEQARKSLRQTLYEIRTALGDAAGEHLDTTRDTVCVNGEDLAVDALRFEALTAGDDEGALADADTLYRGPLLQGLDTGQETFEEWLAAERARLHVRACISAGIFKAYFHKTEYSQVIQTGNCILIGGVRVLVTGFKKQRIFNHFQF